MQCDTLEYDEVQNYMQFHSLNIVAKQDFQLEKLAGILKDWAYQQNLCTVTLVKFYYLSLMCLRLALM